MSSIILRVEDTKENQIEAPFQKKKKMPSDFTLEWRTAGRKANYAGKI